MPKPKNSKKPEKDVATKPAPEVEALADELIAGDHPSLRDAGIRYGFTGKKLKQFGRALLVREEAQKLLQRNVQFMVVVCKAYWDRYDEQQRKAALDELLCGCSFDGMIARIEKPDFKGYRANILRYGVDHHEKLSESFRGIELVLPGMTTEDLAERAQEGLDLIDRIADAQETADGVQLEPAETYTCPDEETLRAGGMELVDDSEIEGPPADLDQDLTEIGSATDEEYQDMLAGREAELESMASTSSTRPTHRSKGGKPVAAAAG